MLVSYKWLQTYFASPLPAPEILGELLTMRAFEVDGMTSVGTDTVFDIKILPDRAHYCLSHRGIAGEISAILDLSRTIPEQSAYVVTDAVDQPVVQVLDEECGRYTARRITGVVVAHSPQWLVDRLSVLGQRSINIIVDATNFVMLDMGQPLHAFDADKLVGGITVRQARNGERITTLDGKDVALNPSVLLIADDEGPLAIAGIKGGTRAQVDEHTKNIILESAYFKPSSTRKTSMTLQIRTDASKRFENDITPEYTPIAMEEVTALILANSPSAHPSTVLDIYPNPVQQTSLSVSLSTVNTRLGVEVPREDAVAILRRLCIGVEGTDDLLRLIIPFERLDLSIPEDIVEEIGRLYGYEKLEDQLPSTGVLPVVDKRNYYREKIRDILHDLGFSEVYLYSLAPEGNYEIELPLSEEKKFLRTELRSGLGQALLFNTRNAPLLGLTQIKLFEFGNVFSEIGESCQLVIGAEDAPGHKGVTAIKAVEQALEELRRCFDKPILVESLDRKVPEIEFSFDDYISSLPEPLQESVRYDINRTAHFQKFSPYPFIARDIAMWVGAETTILDIESVLREQAGELLVRLTKFDEYKKDTRISYAFRLVFQSFDRTLTNEEVAVILEQVTESVVARGWEVR